MAESYLQALEEIEKAEFVYFTYYRVHVTEKFCKVIQITREEFEDLKKRVEWFMEYTNESYFYFGVMKAEWGVEFLIGMNRYWEDAAELNEDNVSTALAEIATIKITEERDVASILAELKKAIKRSYMIDIGEKLLPLFEKPLVIEAVITGMKICAIAHLFRYLFGLMLLGRASKIYTALSRRLDRLRDPLKIARKICKRVSEMTFTEKGRPVRKFYFIISRKGTVETKASEYLDSMQREPWKIQYSMEIDGLSAIATNGAVNDYFEISTGFVRKLAEPVGEICRILKNFKLSESCLAALREFLHIEVWAKKLTQITGILKYPIKGRKEAEMDINGLINLRDLYAIVSDEIYLNGTSIYEETVNALSELQTLIREKFPLGA